MVIDHDMAPVPPAHPPLASPLNPEGSQRAPSPPTFDPDPLSRAGRTAEFAPSGHASAATAGLPPLPSVAPREPGGGHRFRGPFLAATAGVAVVAVLAAVVFGFGLGPAGSHSRARTQVTTRPAPLDVPALRQAVAASVVQLTVTRPGSGPTGTVIGSGIVVDASGVLVTSADLVSGATAVSVRLADGRRGPGQLLGALPDDDVAAIRIPALSGLKAASLGHSSAVAVHNEVVAVGAPTEAGGLPTSAEGVVTAVGESLPSGQGSSSDVIRTDAPIPASAAGGPLVDLHGAVIGLNVVPSGANTRSGYALAMDAVAPLVTQIEQGHADDTPASPSLGVSTADVRGLDPSVVTQYDIQTSDGALVVHVAQPSAAANAGLAAGDVITAIDSQPVNDSSDLAAAVASYQAGDRMQVTYARQGQIANATVTLLTRGSTGN
jgi:putative serine protease PepD